MEKQLGDESSKTNKSLEKKVKGMKQALHDVRAKGQTARPERQVGAWQSFETSPYSKIREVLNIAAAQTRVTSQQHQEVLKQAGMLISDFSSEVDRFMQKEWPFFESDIKKSNLK